MKTRKTLPERCDNPFCTGYEGAEDGFMGKEDIISTVNPKYNEYDKYDEPVNVFKRVKTALIIDSIFKKANFIAQRRLNNILKKQNIKEIINYIYNVLYEDFMHRGTGAEIINEIKKAKLENNEIVALSLALNALHSSGSIMIDYVGLFTMNELNKLNNISDNEIKEFKIKHKISTSTLKNPKNLWKGAEVQSLAFSKKEWTRNQAKKWAKDHKYKYGNVDETLNFWKIRQVDPAFYDQFKWGEAWDSNKGFIYPIYGGVLKK